MGLKVLKGLLILLLLFSFGLCISSFVSAKQCYVTPCYEGEGLVMLWSVDGGKSFEVVSVGLVSLAHVFAAYWILLKSTYDELWYGILAASTLCLSIVLMTQAVFWGQQALMIAQLKEHSPVFFEHTEACRQFGNATTCKAVETCDWTIYRTCQRRMVPHTSASARFNAVTAFSILLALTQALFGYFVLSSRSEIRELNGGTTAQQQPFRPSKAKTSGIPAPLRVDQQDSTEAAREDETSYQDDL